MSTRPGEERAPDEAATDPRASLREALVAFAISLVGCLVFIGLGRVIPFVAGNLHAFVALLFLGLPAYMLRRRNKTLEDHGLNTRGLKRALLVCGAVAVVTFPPYIVGHHFYQAWVFKRPLHFAVSNYSAFPRSCQGAPQHDATVSIWCQRDTLSLRWVGDATITIRGPTSHAKGTGRIRESRRLVRFSGRGGLASVTVPAGGEISVRARRAGRPIPPDRIAIGSEQRAAKGDISLGRSWLWLLELILAQLIAVALPEEVFYRGYLQHRLTEAFPRRRRIFGADVSVTAVIATSALFALGHFLLDFNPLRLGVFFPSLLFGWIRAHTPTLAGCVVYHALCNVLVQVLVVHY